MQISQKGQYALRAIYELARQFKKGMIKISQVAEAQAIPVKFLEAILNELKHGGFVDSRRGSEGGYYLLVAPEDLTVGQVLRYVEGPFDPVGCSGQSARENCPLRDGCVFLPMWERAGQAVADVYDHTTFKDLIDQDIRNRTAPVSEYHI
jgi:Rrf2 family transcriptional regulator, cysteine metabolism repressor